MATVMPRSLKEAVGFMPSNFKNRRAPTRSEILTASIRGVSPSPMVATASSGISGSHPRYLRITPCLDAPARTLKTNLTFRRKLSRFVKTNRRSSNRRHTPGVGSSRAANGGVEARDHSVRKVSRTRVAFQQRGDPMKCLVGYRHQVTGIRKNLKPETCSLTPNEGAPLQGEKRTVLITGGAG